MNKCNYCGKETNNPKYCSRSCSATQTNTLYPRRKTNRKCVVCGSQVISHRHARCRIHHDEHLKTRFDYIMEQTIEDTVYDKYHPRHKLNYIRVTCRSKFKHLTLLPCANCGYTKHVQICHIKSIASFPVVAKLSEVNCESNLIQLCPNCHWELDHDMLTIDEIKRSTN